MQVSFNEQVVVTTEDSGELEVGELQPADHVYSRCLFVSRCAGAYSVAGANSVPLWQVSFNKQVSM